MNRKPEILAPAGSMEALRAAVAAGCDAVYMGGSRFGARAYADNPDEDGLIQAIRYCHLHGVKLYMTVNTLLKQQELDELPEYMEPYYRAGLDAVIVQDMGVLYCLHASFPDLPLHASTQMTLTMGTGVDERLAPYGVTRIVPARELSLEELGRMRRETALELEVFVHGALCYCYSGQCLMSSMQGGRSGNRGRCAQPCRLPYEMAGKKRYLLSPKELCALPLIGELIEAGVDSFKIEGRMKRPEYTAFVTSVYRKYRDKYFELGREAYGDWQKNHREEWQEELRKLAEIYNREGFTDGYLSGNVSGMLADKRPKHGGVLVGSVRSVEGQQAVFLLEKEIAPQDVLEFRRESGETLYEYTVGEGQTAGKTVRARFQKGSGIRPGDKVYRTRHQILLDETTRKYLQESGKLHIVGTFSAKAGEPCQLKCGMDGEVVIVEGASVQAAEKLPAQPEDVRRVLMQTGDTEFIFDELAIELQGDLFLPVGELKRLRREALKCLAHRLEARGERKNAPSIRLEVSGERRNAPSIRMGEEAAGNGKSVLSNPADNRKEKALSYPAENAAVSAAVMDREQLNAVLSWENVKEIILRDEIFTREELVQGLADVKRAGKHAVLALPWVFRQKTYDRYTEWWKNGLETVPDGYLIRNQESFSFLRDRGDVKPEHIRLDANLYITNEDALRWWNEQGVAAYTAPWELTGEELLTLPDRNQMQWICYGRIPLMISAQCVLHNTGACRKCNGKSEKIPFRGEKERRFLAVNYCKNCYCVIYKEEPFLVSAENLHGIWEESSHPAGQSPGKNTIWNRSGVRYEFTTETPEEVLAVLAGKRPERTDRGHFDKGIL